MNLPLMPKATAIWLIENTKLTFDQIAQFCGMHTLQVQGIADEEVEQGMLGKDPVMSGQLAREEIARCEQDSSARLKLKAHLEIKQKKVTKYIPVAKRQDKPDAISWFLKYCPTLTDAQIVKLIGSTKATIENIKSKGHWNSANIKPRDPVLLGLCTQTELNNAVEYARLHSPHKEENNSDMSNKDNI